MKTLSWLLICFGVYCLFVGMYYLWLRDDPNRLAFKNYTYTGSLPVNIKEIPRRIFIKDLGINLPIIPSEVKNNQWETTENGASYLLSSPVPGDSGNSIIYAHNWASLFGNLVRARTGEEVDVEFADKSVRKFSIAYTTTVTPDQSSILAPSKDRRITLYTCTGWFDSKRFVVVAILH